jgi:hypothetical protein
MESSLFSTFETTAFQSFLSQLDKIDAFNLAPEWGMYSTSSAHTNAVVSTIETIAADAGVAIPIREGKEELSRATRSLMELDGALGGKWPYNNTPAVHATNGVKEVSMRELAGEHKQSAFRMALKQSGSPPTSTAPSLVLSVSSSSASSSSAGTPPTTTTSSRPPLSQTASKKRPSTSQAIEADAPSKRARRPSTFSESQPPPHTPSPTPTNSNKPTLLSADQKKANHIQSEQKRRANIRRGYEALCDIVPALREAIKAEEETCLAEGNGKRRRGKMLGEDGEKMDGRAGPRSESVVLQKSRRSMLEHYCGANGRLLQPSNTSKPSVHDAVHSSTNSNVRN